MRRMIRTILCTTLSAALLLEGGTQAFEGVKKSCKIYVPDKNVKRLVLRSGFKGKVVVK